MTAMSTAAALPLSHEPPPALPPAARTVLYLDVLRAAAIFLVLLSHSATPVLEASPIGSVNWLAGCIYNAASRCCVPLFVMISGALLLEPGKVESLGVFFRKRVLKVVVPFLAWSIIYLFFRAWLDRAPLSDPIRHPGASIRTILSPGAFYHLWFVYVILGLYLAVPILRVFVGAASGQILLYFLGVWVVGTLLLPVAEQYLHFDLKLEFFVAEGWTGYFLLGYVLRHAKLPASRTLWGGLLLLSIFFTAVATWFLSRRNHQLDSTFYDYQTPNVALMSAAAFVLCRQLPHDAWRIAAPGIYRIIAIVSATSWGVYLAHLILLEPLKSGRLMRPITGANILTAPVGIPVLAVATLAIFTALIWALRRIPLLRVIAP
jgi:surface polysaccharide O-acyltransferase-like enzyme